MFRSLWIAGAVTLAPLFTATATQAQVVTTVAPPTAVGYVPVRTGLLGLRTTMKPVLVPGAVTTYVNSPVVTTNYLPTTTYYQPEVATTYYQPEVTSTYVAPPVVNTTFYTPAPTAAPMPATTALPATTTYYTPAAPAPNYYRKTYWYSTPAPVPRTVGMPIIGY
ncbi:hypothetical protein [Blastopirellula marina]|nr:hypothetical protein [Blastopirellula marina]